MKDADVGEATRRAGREEEERRKRISDKQKLVSSVHDILRHSVLILRMFIKTSEASHFPPSLKTVAMLLQCLCSESNKKNGEVSEYPQ